MLKNLLNQSNVMTGGELYQPSMYNPIGYPLKPNIVYLPRESYPYANSFYTNQVNIPYNVEQNKAKDQQSMFSFYITIELELFPGKSPNMLQKSAVKCQNSFERIRESWANIFGFDYRPAPMTEAYLYNISTSDSDNK